MLSVSSNLVPPAEQLKDLTASCSWTIQNISFNIRRAYITYTSNVESFSVSLKANTVFVLLPSSIPDYYIKSSFKYVAVAYTVRIT